MNFKLTADLFTADPENLIDAIETFYMFQAKEALKAYLKTALGRIPIRTGFLRGSFNDLETYFRFVGPKLQGTIPRGPEYYRSGGLRILKTPASGIQFVTPPENVIKIQGSTIVIELEVDIDYYVVNDSKWQSIELGQTELLIYLNDHLSEVPDFEELLGNIRVTAKDEVVSTTIISAGLSGKDISLRTF